MTNILAINPGHNGSVAFVQDGVLKYYIEEERLSRMKYDGNPFRAMMYILSTYRVDKLAIGGTGQEEHKLPWTGEISYAALVRKFNPNVQVTLMWNDHHHCHAAGAFYNSGFETAAAIVVDGSGSFQKVKIGEDENMPEFEGYETESIFKCSYPHEFEPIFKRYGHNKSYNVKQGIFDFDDAVTTVKAYEGVSEYLGFGYIEAGKTMGLAPYGQEDENIPKLLGDNDGRADKNWFIPNYPAGSHIDQMRIEYLRQYEDPRAWHSEPAKLTDAAKNLAWRIQKDTQEYVGDLIEKAVDMTEEKNIVISGGYGLNCVANYYYKERFPDLNIFVDPISHDGGISIGMAKFLHYQELASDEEQLEDADMTQYAKDPLTTLYLGPTYTNNEGIEAYLQHLPPEFELSESNYKEVADLIADNNIVAVWNGRSEAGPRALGNRSILYNPCDINGKDEVNKVKGREWFRPFAGTVMAEHADEWFEMRGLEESPFMMYAINVKEGKETEIPAITHVDDTCRIQTVTHDQNSHYYELIKAFKEKTGVPILFNTSFNLAGDPLVETIEDAIQTIGRCDIQYLWLPGLQRLVKCEANFAKETQDNEMSEAA